MNKRILISVIILLIASFFIYQEYFSYQKASLEIIEQNPKAYDNVRVKVEGLIVENTGAYFGPRYVLRESGTDNTITIGSTKGTNEELSNLVSFMFDGQEYKEINQKPVIIKSKIEYHGPVLDAAEHYLEIEKIELE